MSFALQGIAVGFPWNALLSSTDYYRKQLGDTASLATLEAALTLTYVTTNLIAFAWLNRPSKARQETSAQELSYIRVYYAINLVAFFLLGISSWLPPQVSQNTGLFAIVVSVGGLLGGSSAYFQHAIFGIAARIGPARTRAYLFGFAVAGTLASAAALFTRSIADAQITAVLNFGLTLLFLLAGYITFSCRNALEGGEIRTADINGMENGTLDPIVTDETSATVVDRQLLRVTLIIIGLSLAGTLLVFPAFVASFKPISNDQDPHEFTSLLFLLFNLGDLTGRGLAAGLSRVSVWSLLILILVRSGSLGLFGFCNRDESANSEDFAFSDTAVMVLVFSQGVLGGSLLSAAAALAPTAMPKDPGKAGRMVAATIAVALAVGALGGTVMLSVID